MTECPKCGYVSRKIIEKSEFDEVAGRWSGYKLVQYEKCEHRLYEHYRPDGTFSISDA